MQIFAVLGSALGAAGTTAATVGMTAVAGGISALGAIQQAQAASAQAKSAAQAQEYNAAVARNNEIAVNQQTSFAEDQQRRRFRALQAEGMVAAAQSGAGLGGSNEDVLRQNAIANELDALTIRYEGQMKARGLLAQAELDRMQAEANRRAAKQAMTAGAINAGTSLLTSASKAYGMMKPPGGVAPGGP